VHQSEALEKDLRTDRGRVFVLFVQDDQGVVHVNYAYEDHLRAGKWNRAVARPILECLDDLNRPRNKPTVQGYIDYIEGTHHCHGIDPT
jgi:hypothetical protein